MLKLKIFDCTLLSDYILNNSFYYLYTTFPSWWHITIKNGNIMYLVERLELIFELDQNLNWAIILQVKSCTTGYRSTFRTQRNLLNTLTRHLFVVSYIEAPSWVWHKTWWIMQILVKQLPIGAHLNTRCLSWAYMCILNFLSSLDLWCTWTVFAIS